MKDSHTCGPVTLRPSEHDLCVQQPADNYNAVVFYSHMTVICDLNGQLLTGKVSREAGRRL